MTPEKEQNSHPIDISQLAALAQLTLTDSERERLSGELAELIGFAASCKSVVGALSDEREQDFAPLREDIPVKGLERSALLANSPEKADRVYFRVPRVIEN